MIQSNTQDGYEIKIPSSFRGYKVEELLGCGSTCIVVLVENENTHEKYSAKIISKTDVESRNLLSSIKKEIKVLKSLSHPNIIKIEETFEMKNEEEEEFIVIIMEYCSEGDLLSYATGHGFPNDNIKRKIIRGFLSAVRYLHHKGISHGDIKAENVLLDEDLNAKLCDFGYCRTDIIAGDESKNGTLYYAAPELFHKGQFNTLKTDIYAIGVTLYSLEELQFPFKDGNQQYIVQQIVKGKLSIRDGVNKQLRQLVLRCTDMNPLHRPNVEDILKDQYLSDEEVMKDNNSQIKQKAILSNIFNNDAEEEWNNQTNDEIPITESNY